MNFDRKKDAIYPPYPHNQTLFICNFDNEEVMNDAIEIILSFCSRKNLLELLIFKMMKKELC